MAGCHVPVLGSCNLDLFSRMIVSGRVNPRMGSIHFVKKLLKFCKNGLFLAGPHIQAIQISCQLCSNVDIKDSLAHQILQRAYKNFKWPIKIWKFVCI